MDKVIVDATGLKCPLPVLKAQKALRDMEKGQTLLLMATDKNAPIDMEDLCSITSDHIDEKCVIDGVYHITILKG